MTRPSIRNGNRYYLKSNVSAIALINASSDGVALALNSNVRLAHLGVPPEEGAGLNAV
jgi:hypothetical protein